MPLIRRLEQLRGELDLHIEKLRERANEAPPEVRTLRQSGQTIYRRTYRAGSVAKKTALLRQTALEAMRCCGTDVTQRMYFTEYSLAAPEVVSFCVSVLPESSGDYVEKLPPTRALSLYHHGAYEELPAVGRKLLACAAARGLTPRGMLRHIYLEGPPQHKDPKKFITQVLLPVCED